MLGAPEGREEHMAASRTRHRRADGAPGEVVRGVGTDGAGDGGQGRAPSGRAEPDAGWGQGRSRSRSEAGARTEAGRGSPGRCGLEQVGRGRCLREGRRCGLGKRREREGPSWERSHFPFFLRKPSGARSGLNPVVVHILGGGHLKTSATVNRFTVADALRCPQR